MILLLTQLLVVLALCSGSRVGIDPLSQHPLARRARDHFGSDSWLRQAAEAPEQRRGCSSVACSPYRRGLLAKNALARHFSHVETIHADKAGDLTCFLLVQAEGEGEGSGGGTADSSLLAGLAGQLRLVSWNVMHPLLKLHASVHEHVKDQSAFEANAAAHVSARTLRSTSAPRTTGNSYSPHSRPAISTHASALDAHEYELQVDLLPGPHTAAAEGSIAAILAHLQEVDVAAERDVSLGAATFASTSYRGEGESSSGLWGLGNKCLDEMQQAPGRHLRSDSQKLRPPVDFRAVADRGPHGFRLHSTDLHGGRRLQAAAAAAGSLSHACYVHLLLKLAHHPAVLNVALLPRKQVYNNVAKSIVQSNTVTVSASGGSSVSEWPYSNAGLSGADQVIIVGDTGLDRNHCMFRNDDGSDNVASSEVDSPTFDMSQRKVVQYVYSQKDSDESDLFGGHGTHMAGSVAGQSTDSSRSVYDGMAPAAKIAFWDMAKEARLVSPLDSSLLFTPAKPTGAKIFSGSWGSPRNMHDQGSYSIDEYVYATDNDLLAVFAAGNEGTEGYYSVGNPAMAKNVLTVGASESNWNAPHLYPIVDTFGGNAYRAASQDNVAHFSSMGPTFDHRIKPDVIAPGFSINSAKAQGTQSCDFHSMAGTSSATALASGIAAMVRQYFMDSTFYQQVKGNAATAQAFTPSGALLKGVLVHAGQTMKAYSPVFFPGDTGALELNYGYRTEVDQGTVISDEYHDSKHEDSAGDNTRVGDGRRPDFVQGYGRIYLQGVLPVPNGLNNPFTLDVWDQLELTSDTEYSWYVETPRAGTWKTLDGAADAQLRVTLTWWDPPMNPLAEKHVVHDLDLIVTKVDVVAAAFTEPSSTHPIWFGNGGTEPDALNNVEQVSMSSKENKGTSALQLGAVYRVTVRANVLTESTKQKFSLVITSPSTDTSSSTVTPPDFSAGPVPVVATGLGAAENICAADELEVHVGMSSHLGIGWQGGSQYEVACPTCSPVYSHTASMNHSEALTQILQDDTLCLKEGVYTVTLSEAVSSDSSAPDKEKYPSLGQTAVDIKDCYVHLQGMYSTTQQLNVVEGPDGVLRCNYCNSTAQANGERHFEVEVSMLGSIYGGRLSYGWENQTSYSFEDADGATLFTNTLNQGIYGVHRYCLVEGEYSFGFDSISADDDFNNLGTAAAGFVRYMYGVHEYSLQLTSCGEVAVAVINAWEASDSGAMQQTSNLRRPFTATDADAYCDQNFGDDDYVVPPTVSGAAEILKFIGIGVGSLLGMVLIIFAFKTVTTKVEISKTHIHNAQHQQAEALASVQQKMTSATRQEMRSATHTARNEFNAVAKNAEGASADSDSDSD